MSPVGKREMMQRFGATLKNVRWSWDGVRADGSIVFIGWEDQAIRDAAGAFQEYRLAKTLGPSSSPGAAERIAHIEQLLAAEAAGYLVLATAKDPAKTPREIAAIDDHLYTVRLESRAQGVFATVVAPNSAPEASADLDAPALASIEADEALSSTEKQQLVNARRGQGVFRARVELIEKGCRLTGVVDRAHLRAGHIKPWRVSTNAERLDGQNGLLLAPHVDHLFDRGFISFADDGQLVVSPQLPLALLKAWKLPPSGSFGEFTPGQRAYLAFHRAHVLRPRVSP